MKKLFISTVVLSTVMLASCGKSEVCDCAQTGLSMMKEVKEAGMDLTKMQGIQDKYKTDIEKCEKLGEGKSEAERKKMEEEMKQCDSYQEMEKMSKEMMGGE